MNCWIALAFCMVVSNAAFGSGEADPSKDPSRGDAMEATVRKGDAATLKTLLRPVDRTKYAVYTTTEGAKQGRNESFSNLLNAMGKKSDNPCLIAFLEYGISIEGSKLIDFDDLLVFKKHYPDFL
ncbi:MAG: hypothetical protein NTV46_14700, partial [Verrucomicrobia bacterium]|nr:hypothetical protein [Verrucomicrobiota bacterium]